MPQSSDVKMNSTNDIFGIVDVVAIDEQCNRDDLHVQKVSISSCIVVGLHLLPSLIAHRPSLIAGALAKKVVGSSTLDLGSRA